MMEQANMSKRHSDVILVGCLDDIIISDTTACLCNIAYTAAMGALNVVAKREESIAA